MVYYYTQFFKFFKLNCMRAIIANSVLVVDACCLFASRRLTVHAFQIEIMMTERVQFVALQILIECVSIFPGIITNVPCSVRHVIISTNYTGGIFTIIAMKIATKNRKPKTENCTVNPGHLAALLPRHANPFCCYSRIEIRLY